MDPVALASVVASGVVGLGGLALTARNSAAERRLRRLEAAEERQGRDRLTAATQEHERVLARDQRLFDRRASAYQDLFQLLEIVMLNVERTWPILGPVSDPPPLPSEEEQAVLRGRVEAFGSPAVVRALQEFNDAVRDFFISARIYGDIRAAREPADPAIFQQMTDARETARARFRATQELVRGEFAAI